MKEEKIPSRAEFPYGGEGEKEVERGRVFSLFNYTKKSFHGLIIQKNQESHGMKNELLGRKKRV